MAANGGVQVANATNSRTPKRVVVLGIVFALAFTACSASTDGLSTVEAEQVPAQAEPATSPSDDESTTASDENDAAPTPTAEADEAASETEVAAETEAASATETEPDPDAVAAPDWASDLIAGTCFDDGANIDSSAIVDCDGPHDYEVFYNTTLDGGADESWPGFDSLVDEAFASFCDDELVGFAGRTYDLLPVYPVAWVPNEDEWNAGSRSAVCTVGALDEGAKKIGTAAGSDLAPASTDFIVSILEGTAGDLELAVAGPGTEGASITVGDIGIYDDAIAFDGQRILWFVADPDDNGTRSLMVYGIPSGQIVRLNAFDGRDVFNPTSAPGQRVIVSAGFDGSGESELWGVDPDGTSSQLTDTPGVFLDHPAVSADGDRIIVSGSSDEGGSNLWAIDTASGDLEQLTDGPGNDTEPAISPDGSQIVFTSDRSGNLDVWSIEPDGSNPTNLTDHPSSDSQPAYSLETDRVFFQSDRFGFNTNTMFMLRDGSEQASVTYDGVRQPLVLPEDLGSNIFNAAFLNQLRYCDVYGTDGTIECGTFNDYEVVSVTTNPEPPGAPWPGEDALIERLIVDCKAALDERFGADREPREVEPALVDEATWNFGVRTSACWLAPDQ